MTVKAEGKGQSLTSYNAVKKFGCVPLIKKLINSYTNTDIDDSIYHNKLIMT